MNWKTQNLGLDHTEWYVIDIAFLLTKYWKPHQIRFIKKTSFKDEIISKTSSQNKIEQQTNWNFNVSWFLMIQYADRLLILFAKRAFFWPTDIAWVGTVRLKFGSLKSQCAYCIDKKTKASSCIMKLSLLKFCSWN